MATQTIESLLTQKSDIIKTKLEPKDATIKRFFPNCTEDLLWSKDDIRILFPEPSHDVERIHRDHVIALTILVWMKWPFDARMFCSIFLNKTCTDARLPLGEKQVHELGDYAQVFVQNQNMFNPCIIQKSKEAWESVSRERPWPFTSDPEVVGRGFFGKVAKATIAKNCFKDEKGDFNHNDRVVAVKTFHTDGTNSSIQSGQGIQTETEVKRVEFLRDSLAHHAHISIHLAIFYQGLDLFIFFEYAKHGDLASLLSGYQMEGKSGEPPSQYRLDQFFPTWEPYDLIQELSHLASALEFLHEGLLKYTDETAHCAHMDLKPDNILVYRDSDGPKPHRIGIWKITDFGISSVKHHEPSKLSEKHPTIRDLLGKDSSGTDMSLEGLYRAPELNAVLRKESEGTRPGRRTDLWSFGCIANEVLAFLIGCFQASNGSDRVASACSAVENFHISKRGSSRDWWYDITRHEDNTHKAELSKGVRLWWDKQARASKEGRLSDNGCVQAFVDLLRRIIQIDPSKRAKPGKIIESLREISKQLMASKRPNWTDNSYFSERGRNSAPLVAAQRANSSSRYRDSYANSPLGSSTSAATNEPVSAHALSQRTTTHTPRTGMLDTAQSATSSRPRSSVSRRLEASSRSSGTFTPVSIQDSEPDVFRAPKLEELLPRKLELPRKVKRFALSQTGEAAAVLFEGGSQKQVAIADLTENAPEFQALTAVLLDKTINWDHLRVTRRYLAIAGSRKKDQTSWSGRLVDLNAQEVIPLSFPQQWDGWPPAGSGVSLSSQGALAWIAHGSSLNGDLVNICRIGDGIKPVQFRHGVDEVQFNSIGSHLLALGKDSYSRYHIQSLDMNDLSLPPVSIMFSATYSAYGIRSSIWAGSSGLECIFQESDSSPRYHIDIGWNSSASQINKTAIDAPDKAPVPNASATILCNRCIITVQTRNHLLRSPELGVRTRELRLASSGQIVCNSEQDQLVAESIRSEGEFALAAEETASPGLVRITLITYDSKKKEGCLRVWTSQRPHELEQNPGQPL